MASYTDLWQWSVQHREEFWGAVIAELGIVFQTPPTRILAPHEAGRPEHWLPGARMNIVESCFQTAPEHVAVIHRHRGRIRRITYGELGTLVDGAAARFGAGEVVGIAMPMSLQAVVAYLAVLKAGGVVVSIAESFSPPEIRRRVELGGATSMITQDVILRRGETLPMLEKVRAADLEAVWVVRTPEGAGLELGPGEMEWTEQRAKAPVAARVAPADAHMNILFSSGTTGDPKAIPWSHTTPIKAAMDGRYHQDLGPGDVTCWPTNLGWMMGPWVVFSSLMNGGAMALYDDVPTERPFGEFVRDAGVTMLGVVPSLVRQWRESGCMEGLDWSGVRRFSSTGEASNAADMSYLSGLAGGKPVVEYCGGTEIGGGYITGTLVQPCLASAFSTPTLGLDLRILDERGEPAESGEVFLVPPSIGLSTELLGGDHHHVYYEGVPARGLRRHGDHMIHLGEGYYRALGRTDDTMNLGGIKVSSAELERVVLTVEGVFEVAAVTAGSMVGGPSSLVLFMVVDETKTMTVDGWRARAQDAIREKLNPLFKVARVYLESTLPRTSSNKVMRRVLRDRIGSQA